MRLLRFTVPGETEILTGLVRDEKIHELAGDIFGPYEETGRIFSPEEVKPTNPCQPGKVVAIGLNYRDHAAEFGFELPVEPLIFMKAPSSVIGPGDTIVMPKMSQQVDFEAELAVVIGKQAKDVKKEQAAEYVLGYTCLNDVTARDLQKKDGQWTRAKSFDTFCPLGPAIETGLDPKDLAVSAWLNQERKQTSRTSNLVFDVPALIEFISAVMTLNPGDVIATGTPSGVGPMNHGDSIEIRIEGLGSLVNPVVAG